MLKIIAFIMLLVWAAPAKALESPWITADYLRARLLSAVEATGQEKEISAALEIQLASSWHMYWRMPGESGLAPVFDWSASENIKNVETGWPAPARIVTEGLHSFGYKDRVAFPLTITPETPGDEMSLDLSAAIMVCKDICVPQNIKLALVIPAGVAEQSRLRAVIEHMRPAVPHKGDLPMLKIDSAVLGPDALVVHATSMQGFEGTDLFVESGDIYISSPPEITVDKENSRAAFLRIAKPEGMDNLVQALTGQTVTLTLKNEKQSIEKSFPF